MVDVLPTPSLSHPATSSGSGPGPQAVPDGGLLPRAAAPVRRADGRHRAGRRQWNLDAENREPPPKDATLDVPPPYRPGEDDIDAQVRHDLDAMNLPTVGVDGPAALRRDPRQSRRRAAAVHGRAVAYFGRYEDAMLSGDWAMAHSLLSCP